ncbi:MAG: tRNA1(Val) (adenine(37)-N6)-methyltransferase [Flavobacteriales bacterium]
MLIGAWAKHPNPERILDIGSGCGLVSMMLAQRFSDAQIEGVDLHLGSVLDAKDNAKKSKWEDRICFHCVDIQEFNPIEAFDFIVSNPPFFEDSTKTASQAKTQAKHTDALPLSVLISCIKKLLKPKGIFSCILPFETAQNFIKKAEQHDLFLQRSCAVLPVDYKKPHRLLFEFSDEKKAEICVEKPLSIRDQKLDNQFSETYKSLLSDFMLRF